MGDKTDIVIIGAGICGLFAARELSNSGKKVIILEASAKAGGRIRSIADNFSGTVESGAEFIHGNMPLTQSLLKEAGGKANNEKGKFYKSQNGKISETKDFIEEGERVMRKLKSLKEDLSLLDFLSLYFGGEGNRKLRESVINLAEGFDAADASRLSSFAVRDEWASDNINESNQISEGYILLINKLAEECRKNGCITYLLTEVNEIDWQPGYVVIKCSNKKRVEASKALITVSLGVLLSAKGEKGNIQFIPPVPEKISAAKKMGYGPVIKINLEFKTVFWNDDNFKGMVTQIPDLSFLRSEEEFPVWWTKAPDSPFLTGWVGGSQAEKLKHLNNEDLFEKAICALASAMNTTSYFLKDQMIASLVTNWGLDPYCRGAYSYETPETKEAKKVLAIPVADTVYFAGEALGNHKGTVESAMESAKKVAEEMLKEVLQSK